MSDPILAELMDQLANQLQAGRPVDVEELIRAHPERADDLRRLVPAVEVLATLERSVDTGAISFPFGHRAGSGSERTEGRGPEPPQPGLLGDFRIVGEIGRGGMGIVYEAVQISLDRRVALKVLPFAGTLDPRQLQRFQNEARAAASLEHPHIVSVYGVGCERGVHYYAMKFIDGRSLVDVIRQLPIEEGIEEKGSKVGGGALTSFAAANRARQTKLADSTIQDRQDNHSTMVAPPRSSIFDPRSSIFCRQIADWGIQAALALEHAHSIGVVHRDIKPANLMVDGRGHLWVTDFGLARCQSSCELTMSGDLLGTLRYMSPEQALAKRVVVDERTDIYSLGATLYELLTLQPAFAGTDRQEVLRQIAFEEPKPPRRINKSIPAELETIVLKAMEKNPADRYATAQALADDLRRYLMNEPIRARRSSLLQRARKVARRHPGVTVTAAVAIVAGLVLGLVGLTVNNWMVRQEQKRAKREKAIAQAVRFFLRDKLLAQADPRLQADAILKSGKSAELKPNPTIRDLLDRAAKELAPDKMEGQFPEQPLVQAELLKTIGEAYGAIGEYGKAIPHLERARDLQIQELDPDHPDTLATIHSLARSHLDARNLTEAARLFEQVRDRRLETLGPEHADTLTSMNDLARCYFALGQAQSGSPSGVAWHNKALALREPIVKLQTDKLGPDDPDTLTSMNNLANSYAVLNRYDEALELHKKDAGPTQEQAYSGTPRYASEHEQPGQLLYSSRPAFRSPTPSQGSARPTALQAW